ncbi:MAG: hypothetical protein ACK46Q_11365 [Hyphomonas sp.]
MSDFTEGQKAIIADLAVHEARQLLEQGGYVRAADVKEKGIAAGLLSTADIARVDTYKKALIGDVNKEALVPDVDTTREIIAQWHKEQPRWWDVRRRVDAKVGALGLVGVLLLMGGDWVQASLRKSPSIVWTAMHQMADTDRRIDERLVENATATAATTPMGDAPIALEKAIRSRFNQWATADGFPTQVDALIRNLAADPDRENPLHDFVAAAMKDRPLLIFHGRGSVGRSQEITVWNEGCRTLWEYWKSTQQANLLPDNSRGPSPDGICDVKARLPSAGFELPFYARFHRGKKARDSVYVLLQVLSSKSVDSDLEPRSSGLLGMTINSVSMNDALVSADQDEIDITGQFQPSGGFYVGRIDEAVANGTDDTSPGSDEPETRELLHALVISLECKPVTPGVDVTQNTEGWCGEDGSPQELVTLRAFVIVNKDGR